MSDSLLTVRSGMEAMCRREADVMTADVAYQFVVDELKDPSRNNPWSERLFVAIEKRFLERRTRYSDVFGYLQNGKISSDWDSVDDYNMLPAPQSNQVLSSINSLLLPFQKPIE